MLACKQLKFGLVFKLVSTVVLCVVMEALGPVILMEPSSLTTPTFNSTLKP